MHHPALEQHLASIRAPMMRPQMLHPSLAHYRHAITGERDWCQQNRDRLDQEVCDGETWRTALRAAAMAQVQAQALAEEQAVRRQYEQTVVDRLSAARTPVEQTRHERATLQKNRELLAPGNGTCPVCRRSLPATDAEHVAVHDNQGLAHLQAQKAEALATAQAAKRERTALRETIATVAQPWANLHQHATTVDSLISRLNQAARRETDREALKLRLAMLTEHRSIRPRSDGSGWPTPIKPGT
jgi:DNA repair exonuclease SbcCD ATPase subunit